MTHFFNVSAHRGAHVGSAAPQFQGVHMILSDKKPLAEGFNIKVQDGEVFDKMVSLSPQNVTTVKQLVSTLSSNNLMESLPVHYMRLVLDGADYFNFMGNPGGRDGIDVGSLPGGEGFQLLVRLLQYIQEQAEKRLSREVTIHYKGTNPFQR